MTREEYIQNNQPIYVNNDKFSEPKYTCECGGNVRKRLDWGKCDMENCPMFRTCDLDEDGRRLYFQ